MEERGRKHHIDGKGKDRKHYIDGAGAKTESITSMGRAKTESITSMGRAAEEGAHMEEGSWEKAHTSTGGELRAQGGEGRGEESPRFWQLWRHMSAGA